MLMPPGLMEDVGDQGTAVTPTGVWFETVRPSTAVRECTSELLGWKSEYRVSLTRIDATYAISICMQGLALRITVEKDHR